MSCPAWEDCHKKSCIEQYACMNADYWARYWMDKADIPKSKKQTPILPINKKKIKQFAAVDVSGNTLPSCVKKGDWCDKKASCDILGQCIFTIPRFFDKPKLLLALKGPLSPKEIIKLFREHDPEPMRSYYFQQDKNKR